MLNLLTLVVVLLVTIPSSEATNKKGFGLCGAKYKCGDSWALSDATWWYNWRSEFHKDHDTKWYKCPRRERGEFIPMIHKEQDVHNGNVHIRAEAKHLLGFNEPNVWRNGNFELTPERAAQLWHHIEKIAGHRTIIGPAVMRCEQFPSSCFGWYDRFFKACKNCRVDKIAVHSYHCNVNQLMATLKKFHDKYKKPIWLTEFACENAHNDNEQINFMRQIIPKLEKTWYVEKYAWFCTRLASSDKNHGWNLLSMNSPTLSKIGHVYNTVH